MRNTEGQVNRAPHPAVPNRTACYRILKWTGPRPVGAEWPHKCAVGMHLADGYRVAGGRLARTLRPSRRATKRPVHHLRFGKRSRRRRTVRIASTKLD